MKNILFIRNNKYNEVNSKQHFDTEILKALINYPDMGDTKHSDQFVRKFRPYMRV